MTKEWMVSMVRRRRLGSWRRRRGRAPVVAVDVRDAGADVEDHADIDDIVRGVTIGPWDVGECPVDLDETLRPGRHSLIGERRICTDSVSLVVPATAEYTATAGGTTGVLSIPRSTIDVWCGRAGRGQVDDGPVAVAVNVFADASSGGLWERELLPMTCATLAAAADAAGVEPDVTTESGVWDPLLTGSTPVAGGGVEDFYVQAASGPRWLLRLTAYGSGIDGRVRHLVDEIMAQATVIRGQAPVPPAACLSVSLRRG